MGLAFGDEVTTGEVEDAYYSKRSSNSKVLVVVTDSNGVEFVRFSLEWAAFQDELSVGFAEVPVGNFAFLPDRDKFVIVVRCDTEGVNTSHTLGLGLDSLLTLEVPE